MRSSFSRLSIHRWYLLGAFMLATLLAISAAWSTVSADVERANNNDDQEILIVHEWGTFTALQDEVGREINGVNVDDEPVPNFVHNLGAALLDMPIRHRRIGKGLPFYPPHYGVRLETPVLYFYPPAGQTEPLEIDVDVRFRGGWVTEFYPKGVASAPGVKKRRLSENAVGSLAWKGVQVGKRGAVPETNEHVWLAPRQVNAAYVTTASGESDKYLFYRGVGNFRVPLAVSTDREQGLLTLRGNLTDVQTSEQSTVIPKLWLVDIRSGKTAFREFGPIELNGDWKRTVATISSRFEEEAFSAGNGSLLHQSMHAALMDDGLYADEASAMLATWQQSYFGSPGLRMFFLVPRVWTDHRLPLRLSRPAHIERVMVGRIELISDQQRKLLDALARNPVSDGLWISKIPKSANRNRFIAGHQDFGELGIRIPADYQAYLDLGRFRNALVVNELRHRPADSLKQFVANYRVARPAVATKESATALPVGRVKETSNSGI